MIGKSIRVLSSSLQNTLYKQTSWLSTNKDNIIYGGNSLQNNSRYTFVNNKNKDEHNQDTLIQSKSQATPNYEGQQLWANNLHNIKDIINNYQSSYKTTTNSQISLSNHYKLIAKSAYLSATDYHNGEHYSALTDLTSFAAAKKMYDKMIVDNTGRMILYEKPRITDEVYAKLADLPDHTFGKCYFTFMNGLNFKPSQRPIVKYIEDTRYAYVLQRYKQIHDFQHILLGKMIDVDDQLLIKWFQMRQLGLPSATLASLITPILSQSRQKASLGEIANIVRVADRAKFIMNVYYEHLFDRDIGQVRRQLGYA